MYLGHKRGRPSPPGSYTATAARRYRVYRPGTFYTRRRRCPASRLCTYSRRESVGLTCLMDTVNAKNGAYLVSSISIIFQVRKSGSSFNIPALLCDQTEA